MNPRYCKVKFNMYWCHSIVSRVLRRERGVRLAVANGGVFECALYDDFAVVGVKSFYSVTCTGFGVLCDKGCNTLFYALFCFVCVFGCYPCYENYGVRFFPCFNVVSVVVFKCAFD